MLVAFTPFIAAEQVAKMRTFCGQNITKTDIRYHGIIRFTPQARFESKVSATKNLKCLKTLIKFFHKDKFCNRGFGIQVLMIVKKQNINNYKKPPNSF